MARRKAKVAARARDEGAGPTHYLKMKASARDGAGWSRVGAGWEKPNGLYSVRLNRGTVLDWHDFSGDDAEFVLILVPAD